eukprot:snap_masked-scaffold_21-processed-gene-4.12-mRNA-1 protein AED:1.00 eAED:1.00 QI:0/0/0/0/1/1/2/0/67
MSSISSIIASQTEIPLVGSMLYWSFIAPISALKGSCSFYSHKANHLIFIIKYKLVYRTLLLNWLYVQ